MSFPDDGFRPPLPPPSNPLHASTPNRDRSQRPRFAYSGPQNYPRPGSSASKPNPDLSVYDIMRSRYVPPDRIDDSMVNNYGDSYMDTSMPNSMTYPGYSDSFQSEYSSSGSFQSQDSIYYSCNESFSHSPREPFPLPQQEQQQHPYKTKFFEPDVDILPPISNRPVRFKSISSVTDPDRRKPFYKKKVNPIGVVSKKNPDVISKHVWRCSLCDIVFTSSVPYNMHKRGSKHAKKLKLQEATQTVQTQVKVSKEIEMVGTTFRCELCGILANSPYQLEMHLQGVKHKNKVLQQKEEAEKSKVEKNKGEANKSKPKPEKKKDTKVNGNEANIESSKKTENFAKPTGCPTKTDFNCAICELFLNSDVQLQQHLAGKYHKAKVEGTTLPFHAKKKAAIRKAVDVKVVNPNTTEGKVDEQMEVCESNQAERSSEMNKNEQPETAKDVQSEMAKDVQSETAKDAQSETAKDAQSETAKDAQSETAKDVQSEIAKDVQSDTSKPLQPETSKASQLEITEAITPEKTTAVNPEKIKGILKKN